MSRHYSEPKIKNTEIIYKKPKAIAKPFKKHNTKCNNITVSIKKKNEKAR